MFEQLVRFQAQLNPTSPAVITPQRAYDFQTFHRHIRKFAAYLRTRVEPTDLVAITLGDFYLHLIVLNALAELGVAFTSVLGKDLKPLLEQIGPDKVICSADQDVAPGALVLERSWSDGVAPEEPTQPLRALGPKDCVQLQVSSGTTGVAKRMMLTRELIDMRIYTFSIARQVAPGSRLLSLMGLNTGGGAATPFMAWLAGGAAVSRIELLTDPSVRPEHRPNIVQCSVAQLHTILHALPPGSPPMPWLSLWTGGSSLPAKLAQTVRRRITPDLHVLYGSHEAGGVACASVAQMKGEEGGAGFVDPWAQVRIVGEDGRDLEPGETGEVWVRSDAMVTSYLDDPEQTGAAFQDGWFRPGDIGRLNADGLLCITGRLGDMVNFGGVKVAYLTLEEAALACPGVIEAAAWQRGATGRLPAVWVGVKVGEGFDEEALKARMRQRFPALNVRTVILTEIPRNELGKVLREELADAVPVIEA